MPFRLLGARAGAARWGSRQCARAAIASPPPRVAVRRSPPAMFRVSTNAWPEPDIGGNKRHDREKTGVDHRLICLFAQFSLLAGSRYGRGEAQGVHFRTPELLKIIGDNDR